MIGRSSRFLAGGLLLAALGAGLGSVSQTHAQITSCRSDPIVTLSNGATVTMYEDISDTATDVTKISYQLHVPSGVTIKAISYAGAVPARQQSVTLYQDETIGNYDAYTVVYTATPNIPVAAYMSGSTASTTTTSTHTNGSSGQLLHSHLHL